MLGGWISWSYNQLSKAKAEAETEFGKNESHNVLARAKSCAPFNFFSLFFLNLLKNICYLSNYLNKLRLSWAKLSKAGTEMGKIGWLLDES